MEIENQNIQISIVIPLFNEEELQRIYNEAIQLQEAFGLEKWLAMSKFSIVISESNDFKIRQDSLFRLAQCTFTFITHKRNTAYDSAYDVRRCNDMSVRELKAYLRRNGGKQTLLGITEKKELISLAKESVMSMKPLTNHQKQVVGAVYKELNKLIYTPLLLETMSKEDQNKSMSKKEFHLTRLALLLKQPLKASNHIARAKDVVKTSQFIPKLKMQTQMLTKIMGIARRKLLRKKRTTP